jgi:phosphoesterase RecJ-like protein
MKKKRVQQISEEIKRAVSDIINHKLKDPRIPQIISIVHVDVTNDLSYAKIYYSILGDSEKREETHDALESSKGFIRRELAKVVKIRVMPELIFIYDDSLDISYRISELINEVKNDKIKKSIDSANNICIASHLNPDGDNLGSVLALYKLLKNMNKNVFALIDDDVPENLQFLPNLDKSNKSSDIKIDPDLFIVVDCADIGRMSSNIQNIFGNAKNTINIDHHLTNTKFAKLNLVDTKSPATGELLFALFYEIGYELDKDIATCLYAAISTDTGSFKYDSTRKETFLTAAELLKYDININEIAVNLYQKRSLPKTKLLIKAMDNLELYANNKIALVHVDDEMVKEASAKKMDTEGIVEFIRDIDDVEVALFMKIKQSSIKVSIRTKSYVNAIKIAEKFGGGGHVRAAGANMDLDFEKNKKLLIKYAMEELNERNISNK